MLKFPNGRHTDMNNDSIEMIADAMKEYYTNYEIDDLCKQFDIEIDYRGADPDYLKLAQNLSETTGLHNTQRFFKALLPDLLKRCNERVANSTSEDFIYHQQMVRQIEDFQLLVREQKGEAKAKTHDSFIFSAKTEVQTYFSTAKTDVLIVDPWIGVGTLDCVVGVKSQIRLLTGKSPDSFQQGFEATLKRFRKKIPNISIRLYKPLQDRFIVFNEKCWVAGASLKDAGAKTLSLIEIKDNKQPILREIARKWGEAEDFFSADGGERVTQVASGNQGASKAENINKPKKKRSSVFGFLKK